MHPRSLLISALLLLAPAAWAEGPLTKAALAGQELYATLRTSQGEVVVRLLSKEAPATVANFVGLAAGEKPFVEPGTGLTVTRPFYDGLTFHRVIPGFMIQGGDPEGSGRGGPGYTFADELQSGRGFDKVGLLAMANRGPNTNGSQFFITTSTPRHLDGRHTIFGEVISGYPVVEAISKAPAGPGARPVLEVRLSKVTISTRRPGAAPAPAPKGPPR
jgi:peptidyl-prolyl cis-trans isomerase A (cyclophilin A)